MPDWARGRAKRREKLAWASEATGEICVGAITLDGKATRDEIFVDLKERVAALTAAGHTPGLGTVLVGDDPGSHAYVRGKHADCAKVGINSIRRDLPADISQAKLDETIDELNANPECTGYIVQLPLPKRSEERRVGKECRSRWSPHH